MHPALHKLLTDTVALMQRDPRVLAAFHSGSIGTDHEDEHSDVDPVFVVAAEAFQEVDAELPAMFAGLCERVYLWWPERGNCDTWRNYACLFEGAGALLQYDITIQVPSAAPLPVAEQQFLFDKAGLLTIAPPAPSLARDAQHLLWTVRRYWLYVFIHAKYLHRGDPFKLAYAQQELFQDHLEVLRLSRQAERGWWPLTARAVASPEHREEMLLYFGPPQPEAVLQVLPRELEAFSRDARAACARWALPYPEQLERTIRAHLDGPSSPRRER